MAKASWSRPTQGFNRRTEAKNLVAKAKESAKGKGGSKKAASAGKGAAKKTASAKAARGAAVAEVKKAAAKKSPRYAASKYVNFDRAGNFVGYKSGKPKNYVYLPGSRYLTHTKNLRLIPSLSSTDQGRYVRKNRSSVEKAIEEASKKGAFSALGSKGLEGAYRGADFDLERAGKKSVAGMKEYFNGRHDSMHTKRLREGYGPAGRRARAHWSFAFGQDGRKR